jgi:7-carboxy-7-deazaguanine synthase
MKINELFYSIQGEGTWIGLPNIFVRTTGCNLRCSFCDTTYAYENGNEISIEDIINQITTYPCKYVCLTGGEPLLQSETLALIDNLLKRNYQICLETNGSLSIEPTADKKSLMISLDIKCPSSTMHEKMRLENLSLLRTHDQVKCVIKDKNDYNYAKDILQKYKPNCPVFFQPVWGTNPKKLAEWILGDALPVTLGLQLHKILWGDTRRR